MERILNPRAPRGSSAGILPVTPTPGTPVPVTLREAVAGELARALRNLGYEDASVTVYQDGAGTHGTAVIELALGDAAVLADQLRRAAREREARHG